MALWELDQFQGPRFLGFVRNIPQPEAFMGANWLPDQNVFDLAFEYILGTDERPVMAHVMGWDSEAPIHGRPGLGEKISGELPPIKRKARMSEKEIIRFLSPRAGTTDVQDAVNYVYDLTSRLVESVFARAEWLRIKALSEDTVDYNEGGVQFQFDFGLNDQFQILLRSTGAVNDAGGDESGNFGPPWSDTANATPISDLMTISDRVEDETGFRPDRMVLSRKARGYLLQNTAARELIRGASAPDATLTQQELDTLLTLYDLPRLITYNARVKTEQPDGTTVEDRVQRENRAFLLPPPTVQLGSTLWGPTAESRPLLGTTLADQAPGVIAVTYGQEEPPSEWTKAVGVAFPSIPGAEHLAQMELWEA